MEKSKKRFFSKIEINKSGCWSWRSCLNGSGYGAFTSEIGSLAHRFSYFIHNGSLINGMVIDHICENKSCVNPKHLKQITRSENFKKTKYFKNKLHTHKRRDSVK